MKDPGTASDCVGVIEDDAAVRSALSLMLREVGLEVYAYASAREYLDDREGRHCCTCLVLDVRLPGSSGMELQKLLLQQNPMPMPAIVFISGHGDIPMAVEAMRNDAVDFLQKPFKEQQLLDSVQKALALAASTRTTRKQHEIVAARIAALTPREEEVLTCLLQGLRNKEVAAELGLATKTAEQYRANVMRKMHCTTIAQLVSLCNQGNREIAPTPVLPG